MRKVLISGFVILAGVTLILLSHIVRAQAQTTPEERESIRTLAMQLDQATKLYNDAAKIAFAKFEATSPEAQKKKALETTVNAQIDKMKEKCDKAGKDLSMDVNKPTDYLKCVEKAPGLKK